MIARRAVLLAFAGVFVLGLPPSAAQQASSDPGLVGTWTLMWVEHDAGGRPARAANPRGLLVFDAAGHVFEYVSHAPPTPPDAIQAQQTLAGTSGFWGRYRVEAPGRRIVLRPEGAVSPSLMGRELARTFELAGDRLTIASVPDDPLAPVATRWTWERVPVVDHLSPGYRGVAGFWQHVVERRVNLTTGATLSENRRAPSIIVYTPSGYVGVHFPPLNRQPFAGAAPTDEEARAALAGYIGYFGTLGVYPGMVVHNVLSGISPVAGSILRRYVPEPGDEITIRFPPTTNAQGEEIATTVTLRRLSGSEDMLGSR